MIIGAAAEIKYDDNKIAITPSLVNSLVLLKHRVILQKNFGIKAGFSDSDFLEYGAEFVDSAEEVYKTADVILKINPPAVEEYSLLKEKQIIFAFFNYTNQNDLMQVVLDKKITTISYSKIQNKYGILPFVKVSSEITGKTLIRIASFASEKYMGGSLLGGITGIEPMKITVIGAGTVGYHAAKTAASLGADVSILDINSYQLNQLKNIQGIKTYFSNRTNIEKLLPDTDILICAVKRKTKELPPVITVSDVSKMKKGSLIIDTGITYGNTIVETIDRVLDTYNPIYQKDGILYYAAPDMASLAAKTFSQAVAGLLENYLISIVSYSDIIDALRDNREIISGVLTYNGNITDEDTADIFGERVYELSMLTGF